MAIWYICWLIGIFFRVLVSIAEYNLVALAAGQFSATLIIMVRQIFTAT
jgi:hypothetical protein